MRCGSRAVLFLWQVCWRYSSSWQGTASTSCTFLYSIPNVIHLAAALEALIGVGTNSSHSSIDAVVRTSITLIHIYDDFT